MIDQERTRTSLIVRLIKLQGIIQMMFWIP